VTDTTAHRDRRSRFITWFLLGTGAVVAFLSLCQRQKTLEKLSQWEFHLRAAGKVLVLSDRDDLGSTRVPSLEMVPGDEEPELLELARGTDDEAFARALRDGGYGGVVVGTERVTGMPSVQSRLARFRPGGHFHALMLRPDAGLYAPRGAPQVADEVLEYLVRAARLRLSGATAEACSAGAPRPALAAYGRDGVEVALQIQGLKPKPVNTARASRIRRDLYAAGAGPSLIDAVMDAADGIVERFERAHAEREGRLVEALDRYRIELHVLHSFTLLEHTGEDGNAEELRAFLDRALEPGVTGLAVGWTPLREGRALGRKGFRLRLPADAVYWSRRNGTRIAERVLLDARLGKLEDLGKRPHVTLDAFRTIHVMETAPGGAITRMSRGMPAHLPHEDPTVLLARVAGKIASDMSEQGRFRQSYYPVRDLLWLGTSPRGGREDALAHGLGVMALDEAARALDDEALAGAADRALARMLGWLRACPDVVPGPAASGPGELPSLGQEQVLEHCGPVDVTGEPVAVSGWSPGGRHEAALPGGLVFVVHGGTARLGASALALIGLVEHIARQPGPGRRARLVPLVRGLVEFILVMQRDDGSFRSHFVVEEHGRAAFDEPGDAGLALLALSRASTLLDDPRIEPALQRGFVEQARLVEASVPDGQPTRASCARLAGDVPWATFAAADAGVAPGDGPRLLATLCLDPGGVPGARDVLAAAASAEALRLTGGQEARLHDRAAGTGLKIAHMLVVTPGVNDHHLPVPGRAAGGVGRDLLDHHQGLESAFAVVALLTRIMR
jgi:hypothetical protein